MIYYFYLSFGEKSSGVDYLSPNDLPLVFPNSRSLSHSVECSKTLSYPPFHIFEFRINKCIFYRVDVEEELVEYKNKNSCGIRISYAKDI